MIGNGWIVMSLCYSIHMCKLIPVKTYQNMKMYIFWKNFMDAMATNFITTMSKPYSFHSLRSKLPIWCGHLMIYLQYFWRKGIGKTYVYSRCFYQQSPLLTGVRPPWVVTSMEAVGSQVCDENNLSQACDKKMTMLVPGITSVSVGLITEWWCCQ